MNESSCGSTSSPTLAVVSVLDFGHSNRCIMASLCYFSLQFHNDIGCGASVYMHILHVCIFLGEVSLQAFCSFFNHVVHFLIAGFQKFFVCFR